MIYPYLTEWFQDKVKGLETKVELQDTELKDAKNGLL